MTDKSLLERYVELHNSGVRTADFALLLGLFAENAEMTFHGLQVVPFYGIDAIRLAFATQPPTDELVLLRSRIHTLTSDYAWLTAPHKIAGRIKITALGDRIQRLDIFVEQ